MPTIFATIKSTGQLKAELEIAQFKKQLAEINESLRKIVDHLPKVEEHFATLSSDNPRRPDYIELIRDMKNAQEKLLSLKPRVEARIEERAEESSMMRR